MANGEIIGTPYLHMDGGAVFVCGENPVRLRQQALAAQNMSHEQLDWLVPHQANVRIIESTAKHLHLPMDKVVLTLPEQGNTRPRRFRWRWTSPCAMAAFSRATVMLEGIGGGFARGAALVKISMPPMGACGPCVARRIFSGALLYWPSEFKRMFMPAHAASGRGGQHGFCIFFPVKARKA